MILTFSSGFPHDSVVRRRYRRFMTHTHVLTILTLILTIAPASAVAQTPAPSVQPAEKKWSLVRGFAVGGNDVAPGLENAMRAAGFDGTMFNFFSDGVITYPFSSGGSYGSETDLTYRHSRRLAFGIRKTSTDLGSTHGHQEPNRWLELHSEVTTYAPIVYFRVNRNLRVGAGPLAASTDVSYRPGGSSTEVQSYKSKVYGGTLTVTLEGQFLRYFVLGLNASRMWIPEVAVGPFTTGSGASNGTVPTLPALRVNMSNQAIGLSLGIRF
jgi:hypothetical protein